MIGLLWGIPFYLYGRHVARILLFPCAYLVLAVPMSFLNNTTVPLRLVASSVSAHVLNGLGVSVARVGTLITSTGSVDFRFGVDDPCSGLKYLIAMVALTAAYAYFAQEGRIRKWLLFLAAIPLAISGVLSVQPSQTSRTCCTKAAAISKAFVSFSWICCSSL